jgi:hypothetical protein
MRFQTVMRAVVAMGLGLWTAGCSGPPQVSYAGPRCLIYVYSLPGLRGDVMPVRDDTQDLASKWQSTAASAKVVYGTWRLFSDPAYIGFMGDYQAPTDVAQFRPVSNLGSLRCTHGDPPPAPAN